MFIKSVERYIDDVEFELSDNKQSIQISWTGGGCFKVESTFVYYRASNESEVFPEKGIY
jgi:hypothetical protein